PLLVQVGLNLAAAVPAFALVYRILRPPLPPMRRRLVAQTTSGAWGRDPRAAGRVEDRRPTDPGGAVRRAGGRVDGR
ncbi:MAG: hypothetical protein QN130_10820, partial [Armatimonadota bacterium]|nr:hypothetical protein [Armatimonadota bacterium]